MKPSFITKYSTIHSKENRTRITSAGFLIGLFLLVLNDFYLKEVYSNWFTGKLSDFAGLFVFPIFLSLINRKKILLNYYATALFFLFWKTDLSTDTLLLINEYLHTEFSRVVDYSDLFALSVLPASYLYSEKTSGLKLNMLKPLIICVSVFSFYATSAPNMESEEDTRITGRYYRIWDHETFDEPVLKIGYQSKDCKSCFGIVLGPDILSYGYNDDFILAKINPVINDTTKIVYAILLVSKDSTDNFGDKNLYTPLSEKEFFQKRKELLIPDSVILRNR